MSVVVRPAEQSDEEDCARLLEALTDASGSQHAPFAAETFQALLTGQRGAVFVAAEDARLLGLVSMSFNLAMRYSGEYCQLEELIVDEAARGKNVGRLLVQAAIDHARARGCREYGLYLVPSTEHNRAFYEKLGFAVVGTEMRQALDG